MLQTCTGPEPAAASASAGNPFATARAAAVADAPFRKPLRELSIMISALFVSAAELPSFLPVSLRGDLLSAQHVVDLPRMAAKAGAGSVSRAGHADVAVQ